MANLSLRQLDDVVYSKLKLRAAKHATSMELENLGVTLMAKLQQLLTIMTVLL